MSGWKSLFLIIICLTLVACARNPSTRFYLLAGPDKPNLVASSEFIVAVEPLVLPEYLERPQIVVHEDNQQISMAEFDRWAEPLRDNIAQVLAENLSTVLEKNGGRAVFRQPRLMPADYRVHVVIEHFDVYQNYVAMRCHWLVADSESGAIHSKGYFSARESYSQDEKNQDFAEAVNASSRLIKLLAESIEQQSPEF